MFEKIGYYSVKFRYAVIAFWIITLGLVIWLAPNINELSISDQSGYLSDSEPSVRAMRKVEQYFPEEIISKSAILVVAAEKGSVRDPGPMKFIAELTRRVKSLKDPKISRTILSPVDPLLADRLISDNGRVALVLVGINGSPDDAAVIGALDKLKTELKRAPEGLNGYLTGAVSITNSYKLAIMDSAERTIIITIALIIICLILIYRSPILPLVPLMIIGTAYGISRSIVAVLALYGMSISTMTDLFLVVLLFGAGTDYCLFIISRFKEFMADGLTGGEAAAQAIARVGETITSSAGTLIVADIAISFVSVKLFANTGPSLAIGLVTALAAVMTLTPAMLAIIGTRAFWPGKPKHAKESAFWGRIGIWITRVPWAPLTLAIVIMVPLAFYGQGQKKTFDMLADLPADDTAKAGYNTIAETFGVGEMLPVDLLTVDLKELRKPAGLAKIAETTRRIRKVKGVEDVRSLTNPDGKADTRTSRVLRVDYQLNLIAGQISALRGSLKDPEKANDIIPAVKGRFPMLKTYLHNLAGVFPGLSSNRNYRSAVASLNSLEKKFRESLEFLKLPGQLDNVLGQMKGLREVQPEVILPKLEMLRLYFNGLEKAVPEATKLFGYKETVSSLNRLHKKFTAFKSQPLTRRYVSMAIELKEIWDLRASLIQGLTRLKKDASVKMPGALYMPPKLPKEMQGKMSPVLAKMNMFQSSIKKLSRQFAGRKDAFYAPVELAGGMEGDALDLLLNTFTTRKGDAARYQVILKDEPFSPAAMDTVERIRKLELPTEFYVGGNISVLTDLRSAMKRDTRLMWILVCGGISIVLIFLLRSLVAPFYLLGTILLSYNATMGITRFVFEFLLGKEMTWFVPFFMFVLLLALGMDYNIFLMGRVKEEVAEHGTKKGIQQAVLHTGGIITSCGIILAGTFAAMMSSDLLGLMQLSFAITIGVLQDTFITRTTLVPAIVVLLDKWNWWPGNLVKKKNQ